MNVGASWAPPSTSAPSFTPNTSAAPFTPGGSTNKMSATSGSFNPSAGTFKPQS